MNQRLLTVTFGAVLTLGLGWMSPTAEAQTSTSAPAVPAVVLPAPLGSALKSSSTVAAGDKTISTFVSACIAGLEADDAKLQGDARDRLIDAAWVNANQASSVQFFDAYCGILAPRLEALLKPPHKPRVRLNAAIILARVAEPSVGTNHRLIPAVLAALADENPAVVVWGIKAARAVMPTERQLLGATQMRLPAAVIAAMKKSSLDEVAAEVFESFRGVSADSPMAPVLTPLAQQALVIRAGQFAKVSPEVPVLEAHATTFLSAITWRNQKPPQQTKSAEAMYQLIHAAAQARTRDSSNAELKRVIESTAGAFQVVGERLGDPAVSSAAGAVFNASQQAQPPATVLKLCQDLGTALTANATLKGFQIPAAPATGPAH